MANVFNFKPGGAFTLDEARKILPVVVRITKQYCTKVDGLLKQLDAVEIVADDESWRIEQEINKHIDQWKSKVEKLGLVPRGLWIGDFPCDEGYYCWKYPETSIEFWHGKLDGYSNRQEISVSKPKNGAKLTLQPPE